MTARTYTRWKDQGDPRWESRYGDGGAAGQLARAVTLLVHAVAASVAVVVAVVTAIENRKGTR